MKKRKRPNRGANFEREICKILSLWWTDGKRDDAFWRTPGSGARATVRSRRGKTVRGEGDIGVDHPSGKKFVDAFLVELKKGYGSASPFDLLDSQKGTPLWKKWLLKLTRQGAELGKEWLLITRRQQRQAIITLRYKLAYELGISPKSFAFKIGTEIIGDKSFGMYAASFRLKDFLKWVSPQFIKEKYG